MIPIAIILALTAFGLLCVQLRRDPKPAEEPATTVFPISAEVKLALAKWEQGEGQ